MIDFHCHLDLYPDPHRVARECEERGMYILSVTTTPSAWSGTSALAQGRMRTALGLHPQLAHERISELPLFDKLLPEASYVGEIGLDGSPEFQPHWERQQEVFDHVLAGCARAGGRVMSIHSRQASSAILDRLRNHPGAGVPILHWFSGTIRELDRAIELDCWFSVGPAMLRGQKGRSLATRMPRDRILTETDGPFAQTDRRSILPWEVQEAVIGLALLWNVADLEAQDILNNNLRTLVGKL